MAASSLSWSCRRTLGFLYRRFHQSCSISSLQKEPDQRVFTGGSPTVHKHCAKVPLSWPPKTQTSGFHTSVSTHGLMEFFDRKDVWGQASVLCGRPWRLDELRLKSNEDLHKLWYVLLKERNMLLTMQAEYNRNRELFPNPERIEKVEESMENILDVIKERDEAVAMLETGVSTDKGGYYVKDFLGRTVLRKRREYAVPPHMNKAFRLMYPRVFKKQHMKYLALYREKLARRQYAAHMRQKLYNEKLIQKFPHLEGRMEEPTFQEPKVT